MKCLHVNFYSRCVATTVLVTTQVAMKAVFFLCLFKMR